MTDAVVAFLSDPATLVGLGVIAFGTTSIILLSFRSVTQGGMEPPAARLSVMLLPTPQFEARVTPVNNEEMFSMLSLAVQRSSSFCSGNMQQFVTNSGRSFQMRRYWMTLHVQDVDEIQCSENGRVQLLGNNGAFAAACLGRVSAPLPFQQLFQNPPHEDNEETAAPYCLREPVQESSAADPGSDEQFAVSTSIEEAHFDKAKSLLICNKR